MKKVLALIVVMILLIPSVFAEGLDVESLTVDELMQYRKEIQDELTKRQASDPAMFFSGTYVVGVDIRAGRYILYIDAASNLYAEVSLSRADESDNSFWKQIRENETFYLELYDGDELSVSGIKLAHLTVIPMPEWAP